MEFLNVSDLLKHVYINQPQYLWLRIDNMDKCYKILKVEVEDEKITNMYLENGIWLPPIPLHDRKHINAQMKKKYSQYENIKLHDGKDFIESLKSRKDSSQIVAWKKNNININMTFEDVKTHALDFIMNQSWKCRYCQHVNKGGLQCKGITQGNMPSGGPKKANNHVLSEYEYFVSKTFSCPPILYPFKHETELGWYDQSSMYKYKYTVKGQRCNAHRCIHYSHTNQSDQILSFPRVEWKHTTNDALTNTYQFFLPGAMLGHHITRNENICTKCRNIITHQKIKTQDFRSQVEHSWWILEILYWIKVDIYNKKMQKIPIEESIIRYKEILNNIHQLKDKNIDDYIYHGKNGFYQTNTFKNILNILWSWTSNKNNYINRFKKKYTKHALKF